MADLRRYLDIAVGHARAVPGSAGSSAGALHPGSLTERERERFWIGRVNALYE